MPAVASRDCRDCRSRAGRRTGRRPALRRPRYARDCRRTGSDRGRRGQSCRLCRRRHRRFRRPRINLGRGACRQAPAAGQQGIGGHGRQPAARGPRSRRRLAAAARFRTQRGVPVPAARAPRSRRLRRAAHPADCIGRAVSRAQPQRAGKGDARHGLRPSQLAHGPQDLGRFGHADEQGPGGHRGTFPVRRGSGGDRCRRASAEHRAFDGRVRRWLGPGPARQSGHAHGDRLRPRLAATHRCRRRRARPGPHCPARL